MASALLAAPGRLQAQEVRVCTTMGAFTIELAPEAPAHAANFLRLVESGFYNGTIFHRVVADTIVQGGGFDRAFVRRPAGDPVVNESLNGLSNVRGTVAAARLRDPDTATSQFFVNLIDNDDLDATSRRPGYTVFGRITTGMEVVDAIGSLPTGAAGPLPQDVPEPLVVIDAVTIAGQAPDTEAAASPGESEPVLAVPDAVLARIDTQRAECEPVGLADLVNEARAALDAGLTQRARFALENFFVLSDPDDANISKAQDLFRGLPRSEQEGIGPLIAHCPRVDVPDLPDGRSASFEEMQTAQGRVRQFLSVSEAHLECLSDVIDGGSLDDVQEVAAVSAHNETVERMERAAEAFNNELRSFRSRN